MRQNLQRWLLLGCLAAALGAPWASFAQDEEDVAPSEDMYDTESGQTAAPEPGESKQEIKKQEKEEKAQEKAQEKEKPAVPQAPPAAAPPPNTVILRGLNKVTAQASKVEAPFGSTVRFGNLEIVARACRQSAPDAQPDNAALLEVWELKSGEAPQRIFLGWMFSGSPALSGLEHPVYDLTVLGCEARKLEPEKE